MKIAHVRVFSNSNYVKYAQFAEPGSSSWEWYVINHLFFLLLPTDQGCSCPLWTFRLVGKGGIFMFVWPIFFLHIFTMNSSVWDDPTGLKGRFKKNKYMHMSIFSVLEICSVKLLSFCKLIVQEQLRSTNYTNKSVFKHGNLQVRKLSWTLMDFSTMSTYLCALVVFRSQRAT